MAVPQDCANIQECQGVYRRPHGETSTTLRLSPIQVPRGGLTTSPSLAVQVAINEANAIFTHRPTPHPQTNSPLQHWDDRNLQMKEDLAKYYGQVRCRSPAEHRIAGRGGPTHQGAREHSGHGPTTLPGPPSFIHPTTLPWPPGHTTSYPPAPHCYPPRLPTSPSHPTALPPFPAQSTPPVPLVT